VNSDAPTDTALEASARAAAGEQLVERDPKPANLPPVLVHMPTGALVYVRLLEEHATVLLVEHCGLLLSVPKSLRPSTWRGIRRGTGRAPYRLAFPKEIAAWQDRGSLPEPRPGTPNPAAETVELAGESAPTT
jgi:hypothetical protein